MMGELLAFQPVDLGIGVVESGEQCLLGGAEAQWPVGTLTVLEFLRYLLGGSHGAAMDGIYGEFIAPLCGAVQKIVQVACKIVVDIDY